MSAPALNSNDRFQTALLRSTDCFAAFASQTMNQMFSLSSRTSSAEFMEKGISTSHEFFVSILFTGSVYGEFVLALNEAHARAIIASMSGTDQVDRASMADGFREMLNMAVGQSIVELSTSFQKLTITAPRVYFGSVLYPQVRAGRAVLHTAWGEIECFLYIDRMKTDLAASYKEALSDLTVAHDELKLAMSKLQEQQVFLARSEKFAALGTMAAGVAHEINTPLGVVALVTDQLKSREELRAEPEPEAVKLLTLIDSTVQRISRITSGLRVYARGVSGEAVKPTPINAVVLDALELCRMYFKDRSVALNSCALPEGWQINGRLVHLSQALFHLLINACDAAESQSEKWVRLEFAELDAFYEIRIVDSGRGIADSVREKLFDPFFTTKPIGRGTGLGLSVCKGIIEDHKGEIHVGLLSGHTCFSIRLPK